MINLGNKLLAPLGAFVIALFLKWPQNRFIDYSISIGYSIAFPEFSSLQVDF